MILRTLISQKQTTFAIENKVVAEMTEQYIRFENNK